MAEPPRQLTLDLPVDARFGPEDFLVGPSNEEAYATLESWPDWPSRLLHLRGPAGSGKTHLASVWAGWAGAQAIRAGDVAEDLVPGLADRPALLVEDLDRGGLDEPALFHLLNLVRERQGFLLLTAREPAERCGIRTPDLLSRLRLAPAVALGPPDDALLRAVLVKLFLDRQIVVDTSVVEYLAARMERSLARAADLVAELDRETLSRHRRLTRPVAAEILARSGWVEED